MKQVIVVRKDLNMRKGKMIAQGAHASVGVVVHYQENKSIGSIIKAWLSMGAKKIAVGADSEEELENLLNAAGRAGIPYYLVTDAGHTELEYGTVTALAIGPYDEEKIDKITGHLKLL